MPTSISIIKHYVRLLRPANILTAITDVLAGIALSGITTGTLSNLLPDMVLLGISTMGLYGGGIVFNDVFDVALDRIERPERPIPSGMITIKQAAVLGIVCFLFGVFAALLVNPVAGGIALFIVLTALLYNKWMKQYMLWGPLYMGLCRGANLLLGIAIIPGQLAVNGYLALVPLLYIAAITLISRGEVYGSDKKPLAFAACIYGAVLIAMGTFAYLNHHFWYVVLPLMLFSAMIYPPLLKAMARASGENIAKAVKAGIVGLMLLNAGWCIAVGAFGLAAMIVLMIPFSVYLARFFAVT